MTGSALTGATDVSIGSVAATDVVVVSDTEITAVTPVGTDGSVAAVWVTTPVGTNASGEVTFTYAG